MSDITFSRHEPWLAPLAGYSDLPFRLLCKQHGCAVACSEMVSVKGLAYQGIGTHNLTATCKEDVPMVLQLFGAEPEFYPPVMEKLVEEGHRYFDLNAGCPVKKVHKSGSGAALMLDFDRLVSIASTMVKTTAKHAKDGRVGVKFRLGYHKGEETFIELGKRLQDVGVDWVTLHPRYAKQMFMGEANWSKLRELKEALSIPVIGSGDLFTPEAGVKCIEETGVDTIMFARGALYDPTIFQKYRTLLAGNPIPPVDSTSLAAIVQSHIDIARSIDGSTRSFRKIRSLIPRYAKGLDGIRSFRGRLLECADWDSLTVAVNELATFPPARGKTDYVAVDENPL